MTTTQVPAASNLLFRIEWISRVVVALCALTLGYFALASSFGWWTIPLVRAYPEQNARDLAVLMVTYATLSAVAQTRRDLYFDVIVFALSFALWLWGMFIEISGIPSEVISAVAVVIAVGAGLVAPVWKRTKWIWQR